MGEDSRHAYIEGLFPELSEISDSDIRAKVCECWLLALEESQWDSIEALPWIPGKAEFITNVQHVRGTTRVGAAMVQAITSMEGVGQESPVDADVVIAACLLHDVGKLLEYAPSSGELTPEGSKEKHDIVGARLATKVGLSAEIVHCIESHCEPETFPRSLEARIVHWADLCQAHTMEKLHPELKLG